MIIVQHTSGVDCDQLVHVSEAWHRSLAKRHGFQFVIDRAPFSGKALLERIRGMLLIWREAADGEIIGSIDADQLIVDGAIKELLDRSWGCVPEWDVAARVLRARLHAGTWFVRRTELCRRYLQACAVAAVELQHGQEADFVDSLARRDLACMFLGRPWDYVPSVRAGASVVESAGVASDAVILGFHGYEVPQKLALMKAFVSWCETRKK